MDEIMRKKFKDMLLEKKDTPVGQAVILSMVGMLESDPRFESLAELYDGIEQYGNFMTEKEAKKVVDGFIAFDGNRGQKWSMDTIADELRKVGGMPEEKHHYNKWMLYVVMNSEYADYGGVLTKLGVSSQDMPKAIYYTQQITKDPYSFDFLTIAEPYREKELKNALILNIERFLLELGNGFAYLGREYRLMIGQTEKFIDMLFYNLKLECYIVIEIKTRSFKPEDVGQLSAYVAGVNHNLKRPTDKPTIGLLICKDKDEILAKYTIENFSQPIGISEYELNNLLPDNFKGTLPTIEEIEAELSE